MLFHEDETARVYLGDALAVLATLPDASVDSVVSDPPYAEVDRPYGRLTVPAWESLMHATVRECRRVLKPRGSAVFIIQPNSERIGKLRPWAFDFVSWCCREWNVVQDAWWWNFTTMPSGGCLSLRGLMRSSLKFCVWAGDDDCYRNQDAVLLCESEYTAMRRLAGRVGKSGPERQKFPSGHRKRANVINELSEKRGGSTPFNVLPIPNADPYTSAATHGHGAGTPLDLCRWWVRYLTPKHPDSVVLDMFGGTGTVALAARAEGMKAILIEKDESSCIAAVERLRNGLIPPGKARCQPQLTLSQP